MKILITGATGLVGKRLVEDLFLAGMDDIRILTTNKSKAQESIMFPVEICEWNPLKNTIDKDALNNVDVIIHLAGEGVANKKWSLKQKIKILESRVQGTNLLLDLMKNNNVKVSKFISSSAIGYYGDTSDQVITENSPMGEGFLADVCKDWESNLIENSFPNMKVHILRTGLVLSSSGGALEKMLLPFKMGLGGRLGDGKQFMSWIHIDDLVKAYIFLVKNDCTKTIYNGVSPTPVPNREFTKTLAKSLKVPAIFPVPKTVLKIVLGEMSQMLLTGQMVLPKNLQEEGFKFQFISLESALEDIFQYKNKGEVIFKRYQWVGKEKEEVFSFFSKETNLERITPATLNFKVLNKSTNNLEAGTIIDYKLKIHGLPVKWKTRINTFIKGESFSDEQLKGPYKKWLHEHIFIEAKGGTLILDKVVYKAPLGLLGRIVAGNFIKKDVVKIFNYRNEIINKLFLNN